MNFSFSEVKQKLISLKPKMSSGVDKVSNKMLKEGAQYPTEILQTLLNASMNASEKPLTTMQVQVTPIEKPSSDKADPQNFRPIGQCTNVFKVLYTLGNNA